MNARIFLVLALTFCVAVARAEDVEETSLEGVETVEPTFLESDALASGFPFQLPKKLEKTTTEPRYYGEDNTKPKQYVSPEYMDPKPLDPKKAKKNQPVLFTSHYFSPLPKMLSGKKLKVSKSKKGRKLVPFRATVQTPTGLAMQQNGFTSAELFDGRLPNKYDDPRDNMKKTRAPVPTASLLEAEAEVDTTEQAESDEGPVPPPFSQADLAGDEHVATVVSDPQNFFTAEYQAPTWADEQEEEEVAPETSLVEFAEDTDSIDEAEDEMSVNERAAAQIDMDASSDEEGLFDSADEESSEEEADEDEEEIDEGEALEDAENAHAVSLVEEDSASVDVLLAEVDSHLNDESDSEADAQVEADVSSEKGTPGSAIGAGQTWEDAQNERLDALETQIAAQKAAAPKVQAQVVDKQQLTAVDESHQAPEYDSEAERVETVEPEILMEKDAQTVLLEKIAHLKALRRQ